MPNKPTIEVQILEQRHLRNQQCGNWFLDAYGCHHFEVAQSGKHSYHVLVLVHELIEEALCRERGIRESAVNRFDDHYRGDGEPGDDPKAPYRREHKFATRIEKLICKELGIDWKTYAGEIDKLCPPRR